MAPVELKRAHLDPAGEHSSRGWALRTLYERFGTLVAIALSLIIAVVIVIALIQLYERTVPLVLGGAFDPLDYEVFQRLFGSIFTVLIAMEFKHSMQGD